VFADSDSRGVYKREEAQEQNADVDWRISMMLGKCKALDKIKPSHTLRKSDLQGLKACVGLPQG